jgi:acetaldehyde dehydrogenase (acetylating)
VRCISESCRVVYEAALRAGAPEGCIGWLTISTLPGTEELMKHRNTALILATGGAELVKAAYSAGKPAYGVGPGNVPCWVDRSADVKMAAAAVISSQIFDNGTLCCSEQALVVDEPVRDAFLRNLIALGAYVCNAEEIKKLDRIVARGRRMNPDIVGQFPVKIAEMAGFAVPPKTTLLVCPLAGVGWDWPISIEKLCPMVAFYVENGWEAGCRRCIEVLRFGGLGHTLVIHATDQRVIMEYAMKKPAFRILVNAPASQGSVGYHTNLVPSMTLGCGTPGNNITSDNVNPMNLINVKRLAYVNELFLEEYDRTWRSRLEGAAPAPRWGGGGSSFESSPFPAPPVVNAADRGGPSPRAAAAAGDRVPPYRGFDPSGGSGGGPWPLPPRPLTASRGEVLSPGDIESMIARGKS